MESKTKTKANFIRAGEGSILQAEEIRKVYWLARLVHEMGDMNATVTLVRGKRDTVSVRFYEGCVVIVHGAWGAAKKREDIPFTQFTDAYNANNQFDPIR